MPAVIITSEDLELFRVKMLAEIKEIMLNLRLPDSPSPRDTNQWLKQKQVQSLLQISASTLQRLRAAGKLPSVKIGGQHFYKYSELEKLLSNENKSRIPRIIS